MFKAVVAKQNNSFAAFAGVLLALYMGLTLQVADVFAKECKSDGAYGEKCVYEKEFEVEKKVRIQGDVDWKDKVINVPEGKTIEFRVRVKNTGDVKVGSMKMEDILPNELFRTGGAGLTEYWQDFGKGETKTFVIEARIKDSEFDRSGSFEKCVVNKARGFHKDDLVGSDTATVCYGDKEIKDLPKTGATMTELLAIAGLISTGAGIALKRRVA